MNKNNRFVGVITQIVERKYEDGNSYLIAIIESPSFSFKIKFHQKNLSNRKESTEISDGKLIIFEQLGLKTYYEKTTATNCLINCEKEIEDNILNYNTDTINLILQKVAGETAKRLSAKIAYKKTEKITPVANPGKINHSPLSNGSGKQSKQSKFISLIERKPEHALLWKIFDDNSQEYNVKLLATLSEGIRQVDNEQIYDQTKMLLKLNAEMAEKKIADLNFVFYNKASDYYQFLLWLEGFVEFCPTPFLSKYFKDAPLEMKKRISSRLGFNGDGTLFVDLPEKKISSCDTEILFTGIRAKLLDELESSKISIRAAIAWFTNHELFNILCLKLEQKVKVELIIINDYINNWEFGLPFQKFINLGGELYLCEYPGLMHHKFCLIDNKVLINGSYNWTYYAEWFNKENIMLFHEAPSIIDSFNVEFDIIKSAIGNPISELIRFEENDIKRFERRAYTEYLSADLTLKADQIKPKNAEIASLMATKAIMLNPDNNTAVSLGRELKGLAMLEEHSQVILNTLHPVITEQLSPELENSIPDDDNNVVIDTKIPDQTAVPKKETIISDNLQARELIIENLTAEQVEVPPIAPEENSPRPQVKNNQKTVNSVSNPATAYTKPTQVTPSISKTYPSPNQNKPVSSTADSNLPVNIDSYSIPVKEIKAAGFENLRIGIALDTSGSMGDLYKNGTVQKVVERLLALALTISQSGNLDIWTFANDAHKHEPVNKNNFTNYVKQKGFSGNGGTQTFRVVNAISENYLSIDNFKNPVFAIILTDGDVGILQTLIAASTKYPIYWQFVGLGSKMDNLEKLNSANSNMSFCLLNNIETIGDEELYGKLLSEFPDWFKKSLSAY